MNFQDRLAVHKQQINQLPEQLLASNTYDELGQLISKNVGGTDVTGTQGLQKVDYTYNIRGWLKGINDTNDIQSENDVFAFKINYNDPEHAAEALHNGNISETHWKTASDNILRLYHYQYDDLNRLTSGNYIREGGNYHNSFLESLQYDKNGNITRLFRNGDNDAVDYEYIIDELKYDYHPQKPNQLMKVTDESNSPQGFKDGTNTGDDYAYDANGNMTSDQNKNIKNIRYNHLNLPTKIFFGDGNQIIYLYNATGQKLSKVVQAAEEIRNDYLTGFQYHKGELNFFPHAEGYVSVVEGRFKYVFNFTDHLGNIRLSYSDANGDNSIQQEEILEESNYYPFGLKHTAYNTNQKKYIKDEVLNDLILSFFPSFAGDGRYNYKYNGKEYQDELGLNMYDYGARNYDPALGRWMNVDPLAEVYSNYSPYAYAINNPVYFIDPDGMKIIDNYGIVSRFKSKVNSEIQIANSLKANNKIPDDIADKLILFLENVLDEIKTLEKSSQVYNVSYDNAMKDDDGENKYNFSTKEVDIKFGKNESYGLDGHEMKHAHQFEIGKISLGKTASLYDITDETEGYNRQLYLNEGVLQHGPGKVPDFTDYKISQNPHYSKLPKSSLSLSSKVGKELRKKTKEAGKNRTPVTEVYIGWEKDYNSGLKKSKK